MPDITLDAIRNTTQRALIHHGAAPWVADHVADAVCVAESLGNRICGLYYVQSYCQQLRSGRVKGDVEPVVTQPRTGVVSVDAGFGFAQPAFARGLPVALEALRTTGIVSLNICHAHTCTALGYFTDQIARAGAIGMGFTNASPIVAAPGGKARAIGTNPMAFAVPDGQGGVAMQFDQSTTQVALGRITMAKAAGEKIPEGWALDAQGQPTTDPEAALQGTLVSAGGHKGWGFGLMVEIMAAGLTGSLLSRDVKPLKAAQGAPHDLGQSYVLIDPSVADGFHDKVAKLAEIVGQDPGTRMPGQGRWPAVSIDVPDALWAQMQGLVTGT